MRYLPTIILMITFFLTGCEDVITIPLPENQNLVVVEGWITTEDKRHEIRISRTQKFDEPNTDTSVSDASVIVQRDTIVYTFSHQNEGIYLSDDAFQGLEGGFYGLRIILSSGDTIRSRSFERMPETVGISRISFDFFEQNSETNPGEVVRLYFPITFSTDPAERANFYRYVLSRNDTVFNAPQDIELLDDSAINGNNFRNEFRSFNYLNGDLASVELRSINRGAFEFFQLLRNQATSLGTSSGTAPASIQGNLFVLNDPDQVVLGYFSCYSSSSIQIVFEEQ